MSNTPADLKYVDTHEWFRLENGIAVVGITDFAQAQLGDVTFVELPGAGRNIKAGEIMGAIESVKAASDLYAPVSGQVVEVNADLESDPGLVNNEPYGGGWLIKVKTTELPGNVLTAEAYAALLTEQH